METFSLLCRGLRGVLVKYAEHDLKFLKELFERLKSNINIDELNYVYISHADCMEDAKYLEAMVKEEYAQAEIVIGDIGPVIGAHTGPGGLALCYLGKTVKGE